MGKKLDDDQGDDDDETKGKKTIRVTIKVDCEKKM